jgi:hypothetical protein
VAGEREWQPSAGTQSPLLLTGSLQLHSLCDLVFCVHCSVFQVNSCALACIKSSLKFFTHAVAGLCMRMYGKGVFFWGRGCRHRLRGFQRGGA